MESTPRAGLLDSSTYLKTDMMVIRPISLLWILLMWSLSAQYGHSQGDNAPCSIELSTTASLATGDITLHYSLQQNLGLATIVCNSIESGYVGQYEGGRQGSITVQCCTGSSSLQFSWSRGLTPCHRTISTRCCNGVDSDSDGVCDEDDCWPDDSNKSFAPGDTCDDEDPNTGGDRYDENCNCIGYPGEGCLTDYDGDGVCDEDDCWPQDATQSYSIGDYCNDGNSATYNDTYNSNCECVGEPLPCGDIWPDDGCPLTVDVINDDCTVSNIPPNPDDGCPLTYDYFDAENCVIVNEIPDIDDGCEFTIDSFDELLCLIIHEPLPCDDGNPNTKDDKIVEDCLCEGIPECFPDFVPEDRSGNCNDKICDIQVGVGTGITHTSQIGATFTGTVCVLGDLFIDNDFTFLNCDVQIDPDVNIFVLRTGSGFGFNRKTLRIIGSNLFTCQGMWNGISVSHLASIITSEISTISNARRAIHAFGASSVVDVSNTTFSNNNTGIQLDVLQQQIPGQISIPFPPLVTTLSQNTFTDGDIGIRTNGVDILPSFFIPPGGILGNALNAFENLRVGISALGRTSLSLSETSFDNTFQHCVNQAEGDLLFDIVEIRDCAFRGIQSMICLLYTSPSPRDRG